MLSMHYWPSSISSSWSRISTRLCSWSILILLYRGRSANWILYFWILYSWILYPWTFVLECLWHWILCSWTICVPELFILELLCSRIFCFGIVWQTVHHQVMNCLLLERWNLYPMNSWTFVFSNLLPSWIVYFMNFCTLRVHIYNLFWFRVNMSWNM